MNKEQILALVKSLALSQGFYGRLLESLNENPEYLQFLEDMNFKDSIEFIMYIEG